jgi:F-type H+-transporting ATPase subunit c
MFELLTNAYAHLATALMAIMPNLLAAEASTGQGIKIAGAGLAGIGVLGAGIGQGNAGAGACLAIGRNPEAKGAITQTMIISAGIAESGAIYALIIAIIILFVA